MPHNAPHEFFEKDRVAMGLLLGVLKPEGFELADFSHVEEAGVERIEFFHDGWRYELLLGRPNPEDLTSTSSFGLCVTNPEACSCWLGTVEFRPFGAPDLTWCFSLCEDDGYQGPAPEGMPVVGKDGISNLSEEAALDAVRRMIVFFKSARV
ncbi:MAG TPA: hypothetical protein VFQ60_03070 [Patescibacteria group bacterium]|nr:hypothetical protein [Patescibacteria group bacterium]